MRDARAGGYALTEGPAGVVDEHDTFRCNHCGGHHEAPVGKAPFDFCQVCMSYLCPPCASKPGCRPFMARIERAEERDYRRRQLSKVLGL